MGKSLKPLLVMLLMAAALLSSGAAAVAQKLINGVPENAVTLAPILVEQQKRYWPEAVEPWTIGGLIEQESCYGLTHPTCWNPKTEMKTYREYGFGLAQITIAYDANGKERFNRFTELKQEHASLRNWQFSDRYNPNYQLLALVENLRDWWGKVPPTRTLYDHWAFTLSSYNGGLGGVQQDVKYCRNSSGCDPQVWFGNVETHSLKSRVPVRGYKRSW